jgi:hypothetical protein
MRTLWFGTRGFERWIKMPRIDMERGHYGWSGRSDHLAGGVTVKRSIADHYEAAMSWNAITSQETARIRDVLAGTYATDANQGLLYFNDPAATRLNLFNDYWAAPYKCAAVGGAPSLTRGVRPTLTATGSNSVDLPPYSAVFTVDEETAPALFYAPIPPSHTAHFAFYGPTLDEDAVQYRTYSGETAGSWVPFDVLAHSGYGSGLSTATGVTGIEFSLAASTTITTAVLQILPAGTSPASITSWLSGGGHSGCEVDGQIAQTLSRATEGRTREVLAVRLVETGGWL